MHSWIEMGDQCMSTWLLYTLLSAVMAALVAVFGKIGLHTVDANTATAVRVIIMAIFLFLVVVYEGKLGKITDVIMNKRAMLYITLSGIAGALSWLFYFVALKKGKVTQVASVDKLSVVIAVLLSFIFLKEKIAFIGVIGVLMIAVGAILVSLG